MVYILQGTITDHRDESSYGVRAGSGLARGQEHNALAGEQGKGTGGGDLGRYRQAIVVSGPKFTPDGAEHYWNRPDGGPVT